MSAPQSLPPSGKVEVSRAAEDKLTFKLGLAAEVKCADLITAYNLCLEGRTVSAAWACRALYRSSTACIKHYVNDANVEELKRRWVAAGRPTRPDWDALLEGIVAPEHRTPVTRQALTALRQQQQQQQQQQ